MSSPHHGEILEIILRTKNINLTDLAKKLGISRPTLYNWFLMPHIPRENWARIGEIINYDFSDDIPKLWRQYKTSFEDSKSVVEEESEIYSRSQKVTVAVEINGDERLLDHVINKIKKINEALKV